MGRHLAKRRSKVAGRRLARLVSNPAGYGQELVEQVGPGVAAYTAARLLHRLAFVLVSKKWPNMAKHAGVISSVATFAATWFLGHKVKLLAKYHQPIVVGTGIAAAQGLLQAYVPKIGWMVSDIDPDQYISRLPGATPVLPEMDLDETGLLDSMGDNYIDVDESVAKPTDVEPDVDDGGEELDGLDPEKLGSLSSDEEGAGVFAAN
jgi:hypothetical protein